jgi:hypothetical protein
MRRQHLDDTTFFCVSQMYHTKEGEQYDEELVQLIYRGPGKGSKFLSCAGDKLLRHHE